MLVQNGATVTYQGTWPFPKFLGVIPTENAGQVVADVSARLVADGIQVSSTNYPHIDLNAPFAVTLTLFIANGLGYGSEQDVISIVRHEVYTITGSFPLADSIPFVKPPASYTTLATGQPNVQPNAPNTPGSPNAPDAPQNATCGLVDALDPNSDCTFSDWIGSFNTFSSGLSTAGIVIGGLVLTAAILLIYSGKKLSVA